MLRETYNNGNSSPLREKSFNFALRIVKLYKHLTTSKNEYILSKQVLRAGTNPGAMVRESNNAESAADFIHKLSIGLKEIGETEYWLELLFHSGYLTETEFQSLQTDAIEVGKMLTSSIKTKKKNLSLKTIPIIALISTINYFL